MGSVLKGRSVSTGARVMSVDEVVRICLSVHHWEGP